MIRRRFWGIEVIMGAICREVRKTNIRKRGNERMHTQEEGKQAKRKPQMLPGQL